MEPSKPENYEFLWNPCTPFSLSAPDGCKDVLVSLFYKSRLRLFKRVIMKQQ